MGNYIDARPEVHGRHEALVENQQRHREPPVAFHGEEHSLIRAHPLVFLETLEQNTREALTDFVHGAQRTK